MRRIASLALVLAVFAATLPVGTAQAPGAFEATDPRGDPKFAVATSEAPVGAGVGTPPTDRIDIVGFRATDEAETLLFELRVADLKSPLPDSFLLGSDTIDIQFGVPGHPIVYRVRMTSTATVTIEESRPPSAMFCIGAGPFSTNCGRDPVPVEVDTAQSTYRFRVPKTNLLARNVDGSPFGQGEVAVPSLGPGSAIGPWKITAQRWYGLIVARFEDTLETLEGTSGPFLLKTAVPNQHLVLRRVEAPSRAQIASYDNPPYKPRLAIPPLGVILGRPTPITLVLENTGEGKRLVNLEAAFEDPAQASKWTLQVPPAIEVPSGQKRNATITVTTSPDVGHRDVALVRLFARSVASNDLGFLRLALMATSPIDPGETRIYLHSGNPPAPAGRACVPYTESCTRGYFWLNTQSDDPLANHDDVNGPGTLQYGAPNGGRVTEFNYVLDTPIATPLLPTVGRAVTAKIVLSARADFSAKVDAAFTVTAFSACSYSCGDERTIAIASKEHVIGATPSGVELTMPIETAQGPIEAGPRYLRLRVTIASTDPRAMLSTGVNSVLVHSKDSQLVFPLSADSDADAPASHLRFYVEGDKEEFLNPGKTKLFRVRLANEGPAPDRVIVNATINEGWGVQVQPGQRFELQSGESVGLGVLVTAPESAAEGAKVNVTLTAESERFTAAAGRLLLRAVATRGVEMDDDAQTFEVDEDTQKRVIVEAAKKSPGVSLGAIVLVVLVAAVWRRRADHECPEPDTRVRP